MATRSRKSWAEKLVAPKDLPKVITLTGKMCSRWGAAEGQKMVIPAPLEVDAIMRKVPRGKLITIQEIRESLARQHGVALTCPLTTGIFAWIAAHAAAEAAQPRGGNPYWRTLKTGGEVNPRFPGGPLAVCRQLRAEGHKVIKKGKRYIVAEYQKSLARLP